MNDDPKPNILDSSTIFKNVDALVKTHSLTYIDAIVHFCERNGLEIETVAALIKNNGKMRAHLKEEGENLRILPKTDRLPI